ncbi:MAG: hypothetical protein HOG89_02010 [Candidatus Peribacter sp.]|nr:hypothetical protein [Candidatus Peribacter sp.]MBT4392785.1 hypothetical protein [Candidatus Peribacter sp.]MBT4600598.1 hypothetical protein [Candidatus Peribacter sp.]MBT5637672.1 hypothetical protein [Candidatus Peribacter sp.]MBT5937551.1 hypothetical protein [Candidatus Peribacter sp.]
MTQDNIEAPEFESPRVAKDYHNLTEELREKGMDVLSAKEGSVDQRKDAIKYLKETYNLNGEAERIISDLELFHQEAEAKKEWSTWDYIKYPFAKTWEVMKAHPYLSTAAIIATAGAGAYYTGMLTPVIVATKEWLVSLGLGGATEAITETVEAGAELTKDTISAAKDGAGALMDKVPVPEVMPDIPPVVPPAPVPNVVPSLEEADAILKALEQSG